ncbi:MAG: hypothetical protein ACPGJV_13710, partial [Bacteriovoracaceae bacterium]
PKNQRLKWSDARSNSESNEQKQPDQINFQAGEARDTDTPNSGDAQTEETQTSQNDFIEKLPVAIRGCKWSSDGNSNFENYHPVLGSYTLCQTGIDTEVYLQLREPPGSNVKLCLIPTTNQQNSVTYIGEPRCFYASSATEIYKINLLKNRANASSLRVTGVAMMREEKIFYPSPFGNGYGEVVYHPDAYLYCLQVLEITGDPRYCYTFDQMGQYVQHNFF